MELSANEVRVLVVPLDRAGAALESALDDVDRARAARFVFPELRRRFVAAHAGLRTALGAILCAAPAALRFVEGEHGKPSLVPATDLRFNLSHSGDLALLAVARGRELGVDVEDVKPRTMLEQVAARFFSPYEAAALRALPPAERASAFFRIWTRKEAFIKAKGSGVFLGLHTFDVSVLEHAELVATRPDPAERERWTLCDLPAPLPGFAAALAVEGRAPFTLRIEPLW